MYSVNVNENFEFGDAWDNFLNWAWKTYPKKDRIENDDWLDIVLAQHHGKNVHNSECIEFETEEDFVIFKLKFS